MRFYFRERYGDLEVVVATEDDEAPGQRASVTVARTEGGGSVVYVDHVRAAWRVGDEWTIAERFKAR